MVLYSLIPLGQLLPLVGRMIVRHVGSVRTMASFMAIRNLLMLPIMAAPLLANAGRADIGVWLIIASVIGFNLARGIAITGNNAIIGAITSDADRGSFLSRQQVVTQLAAIGTGVAMGLLLQDEAPLVLYSLLFAAGIATGLEDLANTLIAEVDTQPFTTAYLAAEIIGRRQVRDGIPALRRGLSSDDFFLAGKSMVALGRLGDHDSLRTIENLFRNTGNPYLLIHKFR